MPLALVVSLAAGALVLAARRGWGWLLLASGTLGWLTGTLSHNGQAQTCARRWSPGPQAAILRLHDPPSGAGLTGASVEHSASGCTGRLKVRFTAELAVPAGSRLVAVGSYLGAGVLRIRHVRVLAGRRLWRYALRERVAGRISELYGPRASLVDALVLGRRDHLDPELRRAFADSGIAHLLAISGLHVGILAAWVELIATLLAGSRRGRWAGALATWGYVSVLGFPSPATRAAAFLSIRALALERQRHPPSSAVLALAALVVLVLEPGAATDVGAWLSFAAVWGTSYGASLAQRSAPWGGRALAVSTGATLATAPITAYAFGAVAPVGVLTNLVAVPLSGVAVPGIFASLLLGETVAGGAGLALAVIEWTADLAASLPAGCLRGTPGFEFALPWLVALLLALWVLRERGRWPRVHRRVLAIGALLAWSWVAVGRLPALGRRRQLEIHFIDVGQGDAIAVRTPQRRWLLIDAGPRTRYEDAGRRVVLPFLRRQGVRKLDLLVISHGDADHLGGAPALLGALEPALVLEPGQPLASRLYLEYLALADRVGSVWRAARAGDTVRLDGVILAVLHPDTSWLRYSLAANENSLVLRLSFGELDVLFTGDIGAAVEEELAGRLSRTEVLKVAHHGSRYSSSAAWLRAVAPDVGVISVGNNRYGHPAPEVLRRLQGMGVEVFRTDQGGTVTIRSDGRYFEVVQDGSGDLRRRVGCFLRGLLPSSVLSSNRSGCTPARRASYRTFSTTSR